MKKYSSQNEALERHVPCRGRTIVDVGCGNGDTVRWLAGRGARAIGVDKADILVKARAAAPGGGEAYLAGGAERLPVADGSADALLYLASFHHVPPAAMEDAKRECRRALKPGGRAVFVEPVYRPGAYCEITRLVDDEAEWLRRAHGAIVSLPEAGLAMETEEFFYLERSYADYVRLIEFFVPDAARRRGILAEARAVTERFGAASGQAADEFRFRSVCRLNVLGKPPGTRGPGGKGEGK